MEGKKPLKFITLYVIIISALAGALYGLDIGIIGGSLDFITKEMSLTPGEQGMIVGAVLGGGAIAILITGVLADWFGRKKMIVFSGAVFIVGVILICLSYNYYTILTGRLVMGIGVGISAILIPLYITESAPARVRGRAVTCFQLFLTGGILVAYLICLAFVKSGNWRAMFGVIAIPGIIFLVGTIFIPESPVWYFMKNMIEKSRKSLSKFHDDEDADIIMLEMQEIKKDESEKTDHSIWRRVYILPFIIAFMVACLTQMTGINSILQYAPTILNDAGSKSQAISIMLGTGVTVINFFVTVIALMLIDKLGRKPLLVFSTCGVAICLLLLGFTSMIAASNLKVILLSIGMFGFVFFYAIGIGVVVWLAMSELLPTRIRSKGLGICLFANSMISTILAAVIPSMEVSIGFTWIFFGLAIFTIGYFLIAVFMLPETKGKTIEEIEMYFRYKKNIKNV